MAASEAELKALEEVLHRDQAEWANGLASRQRELLRDTAKHEAVIKKLTLTQEKLTDAEATLIDLTSKQRALTGELQSREARSINLDDKITQKQLALTDLENVIEARRANIDGEMSKYAQKRRVEANEDIKQVEEKLASVNLNVASAQEQLKRIQDNQTEARRELAGIVTEHTGQAAKHEQRVQELQSQLAPIEQQVTELNASKDALTEDVQKLLHKRSAVLSELAKAEAEHQNFLDYERRARKELDAKDRSLRDKADELATADQFIKARRSYLPPL